MRSTAGSDESCDHVEVRERSEGTGELVLHVLDLGMRTGYDYESVSAMVTSPGPGVAHAFPSAYSCVAERAVYSPLTYHRDRLRSL